MELEAAVQDRLVRKLWLSVLKRAGDDAEGQELYVTKVEESGVVRRAKRYLTTYSRSLEEVCCLANLSLEQAQVIVELNWRKYRNVERTNN